jgi:hypothetical protein
VNDAQLPPEVTRSYARAGEDLVTPIRHGASDGRITSSIGHSSVSPSRRAMKDLPRRTTCAKAVAALASRAQEPRCWAVSQ